MLTLKVHPDHFTGRIFNYTAPVQELETPKLVNKNDSNLKSMCEIDRGFDEKKMLSLDLTTIILGYIEFFSPDIVGRKF